MNFTLLNFFIRCEEATKAKRTTSSFMKIAKKNLFRSFWGETGIEILEYSGVRRLQLAEDRFVLLPNGH
jgi:hypothetical protein